MLDSEDIGTLEELETLEPSGAGEDFWNHRCVANLRRSLQPGRAPAMLLDYDLKIRWVNPAFQASFGAAAAGGADFFRYFAESLGEEARIGLARDLRSAEGGHSWYGRLEKKGQDHLPVICNLLLLPLFDGHGGPRPVGFQGIFDDLSDEHRRLLRSTYLSLLEAARLKDNDTGNHIERVNRYSAALARSLAAAGNSETDLEFVENIGFLAAMHDVGKIGTPDDILNKAGRLDPWEWEVMKEHTINGAYIMARYPHAMGRQIALRHHEQWDGNGYPHGLLKEAIPLAARIVAVADVYDALRMKRPYKKPLPHEEARSIILAKRGTHLDPLLVDVFSDLADEFREIFESLKEGP